MDAIGGFLTRLWWGGDPDEKNPVSGMSRRDVKNVKKSWAKIYADPSGSGFLIFSRLFEVDPESKTFFPYIANATKEEMAQNTVFRSHNVYIMAALNTAVENVTKPEVVVPIMNNLGQAHKKRNIRRKYFLELRDVLVNYLQNDLQVGEDVVASWAVFVSFMYEHIFTGVKD